ncbi:unnamed protein product [Timema podura]|uniref:Uncharacterized protein n=1 Tax=Timema podura TaxID=61482 RepID=A0ABN7PLZ2_TIMPD|nr:unnamed protein product [Timema podura]
MVLPKWFSTILPRKYGVYIFQRTDNHQTICTLVFPKSDKVNLSLCFTIPLLLFACLLPMGLLVYHYQRIFQKLLSTRNRWAVPCVVVSSPVGTNCSDNTRRDSELSFVGSLVMPWSRKASNSSTQQYIRNGSMSQHEELQAQ